MAIKIYQGSTSTDSIVIQVTGLNTNYPTKMFDVYLNGSYVRPYEASTYSEDTVFQISNLAQGTSYQCEVVAFYYDNGNWWPDPATNANSDTITITTSSSGGGGGGSSDVVFITRVSGTTIQVDLNHIESSEFDTVYYYLYSSTDNYYTPIDSGSSLSPRAYYDFQNLSSGDYKVSVDYSFNGSYYDIPHVDTGEYLSPILQIGSGPTPPTPTTPTFTASVINNNQIFFEVDTHDYDCYLRYFVRLTSDENNTTYDTWQDLDRLSDRIYQTVPDLQYNTWYTVNVGYSTNQYSGSVTWIGPQTLQTYPAPQPQTGYVYIYTSQGWKKAIPYIYTGSGNNQGWKQAIPYIYNGSQWKECGE